MKAALAAVNSRSSLLSLSLSVDQSTGSPGKYISDKRLKEKKPYFSDLSCVNMNWRTIMAPIAGPRSEPITCLEANYLAEGSSS